MSLILNALKKSEAARKEGANPSVRVEQEIENEEAPRIRWTTIALAVLLVVSIGTVGVIKFLPSDTPRPEPEQVAEVAPEATPAVEEKPIETKPEPEKTTPPSLEKTETENTPVPEQSAEPVKTVTNEPAKAHPKPEEKPGPDASVNSAPVKEAVAAAKPVPLVSKPMEAPSVSPSAEQAEPAAIAERPLPAVPESVIAQIAPPKKPLPPQPITKAIDPEAANQHLERAEAYEQSGQTDLAIEEYDRAIESDKNFADAYFGRGWAHEATQAHDNAIRDFSKAVSLRPTFAEAYYARAWANEQIENTKQAILDYSATLRLEPDHLNASLSRGILQFYAGEMGKAGEDFQTVQDKGVKDLSDFGLLWLYLSRARSSSDITSLKAAFADKRTQTEWPGILFRAFIGNASPAQVINAMNTRDRVTTKKRQCVGYFFLGQHRLIQGDAEGARRYFAKTLETKITSYRQYWAAKIELQRLGAVQ